MDQVDNTFSADQTNLGAEFSYNNMVFLHGGYIAKTDYNETTKGVTPLSDLE